VPTDTAFTVTEFLEQYFEKMMDYKFTSIVEADFDKIAAWDEKYETMLGRFWDGTLKKDLLKADENAEKVVEMVGKDCPKCGEWLVFKYSKWGKFIGCSGYPECKHIDQPEEEKNALDALKAKYEWKPCPDGVEWTIVVKTGRYGPFLSSSEWPFLAAKNYPAVKIAKNIPKDVWAEVNAKLAEKAEADEMQEV